MIGDNHTNLKVLGIMTIPKLYSCTITDENQCIGHLFKVVLWIESLNDCVDNSLGNVTRDFFTWHFLITEPIASWRVYEI